MASQSPKADETATQAVELLGEMYEYLDVKCKIEYYSKRASCSGFDVHDVASLAYEILETRIRNKLLEGTSAEEILKNARYLTFYPAKEAVKRLIEKSTRQEHLGEGDIEVVDDRSSDHTWKWTFLRQCVDELLTGRKRQIWQLLTQHGSGARVARLLGVDQSYVQRVKTEAYGTLANCIEHKMEAVRP